MPELPDIEGYIAALRRRVIGARLERVRVRGPFLLRTFEPPLEAVQGLELRGLERLGKRIVFEFEGGLFLVLHLMIAGRLLWKSETTLQGKIDVAAFDFSRSGESGCLVLTEAGTKKRASLHVLKGRAALGALDPGGIDVLLCSPAEFSAALRAENRTLKRRLTDPRAFSGIGNAFSDEILHAARLSPVRLTGSMTDEEIGSLWRAARAVLSEWTERLQRRFCAKFPGVGDVTAFRPEFAVHGKYAQPCPVCGAPVQRIVRADHETNYCAACQTGGRVLADRSLSRLLKDDWPRTLEEWESEMG